MLRQLVTKPQYLIVSLVGFVLLALTSGLLWMRRSHTFPILPPGVYLGTMTQTAQPEKKMYFSVHQRSEQQRLVDVFADGFEPQLQQVVLQQPLTVPGDALKVSLRGALTGTFSASGVFEILNPQSAVVNSGRWELSTFVPRDEPLNGAERAELLHWLSLAAEIRMQDAKVIKIEQRLRDRQAEVERLAGFVNDRDRLKASADQKFAQVSERLAAAQGELESRKTRARDLESRVVLSQRVTPMGRLVTLARESNERELRWVIAELGDGGEDDDASMEAELARGEEILKLRSQIAAKRAELEAISSGELTGGGTHGE